MAQRIFAELFSGKEVDNVGVLILIQRNTVGIHGATVVFQIVVVKHIRGFAVSEAGSIDFRLLCLDIGKDFRQLLHRNRVRHRNAQLLSHLLVIDKTTGLRGIGIRRNGVKRAIHPASPQLVAQERLNISPLAGQQLIQRKQHTIHRHVHHGHRQSGHDQVNFLSAGDHHADLLRMLRNTHVEDLYAYIDGRNRDSVDGFLNGRNVGIFRAKGDGLNHYFIWFLRIGERDESKDQGKSK